MNENSIYWEIDIDERRNKFFFNGYVSYEEYEKIKLLDKKTVICFGEISKHHYAICDLSEICFF